MNVIELLLKNEYTKEEVIDILSDYALFNIIDKKKYIEYYYDKDVLPLFLKAYSNFSNFENLENDFKNYQFEKFNSDFIVNLIENLKNNNMLLSGTFDPYTTEEDKLLQNNDVVYFLSPYFFSSNLWENYNKIIYSNYSFEDKYNLFIEDNVFLCLNDDETLNKILKKYIQKMEYIFSKNNYSIFNYAETKNKLIDKYEFLKCLLKTPNYSNKIHSSTINKILKLDVKNFDISNIDYINSDIINNINKDDFIDLLKSKKSFPLIYDIYNTNYNLYNLNKEEFNLCSKLYKENYIEKLDRYDLSEYFTIKFQNDRLFDINSCNIEDLFEKIIENNCNKDNNEDKKNVTNFTIKKLLDIDLFFENYDLTRKSFLFKELNKDNFNLLHSVLSNKKNDKFDIFIDKYIELLNEKEKIYLINLIINVSDKYNNLLTIEKNHLFKLIESIDLNTNFFDNKDYRVKFIPNNEKDFNNILKYVLKDDNNKIIDYLLLVNNKNDNKFNNIKNIDIIDKLFDLLMENNYVLNTKDFDKIIKNIVKSDFENEASLLLLNRLFDFYKNSAINIPISYIDYLFNKDNNNDNYLINLLKTEIERKNLKNIINN